jgi:ATP-binding cassette subfamily B protein
MLIGALAEVLSLGAIIPFLAILADPVQALQRPIVSTVIDILDISSTQDIRWQLTLLFAITAVVAGIVRFVMIYAIAKLNFGIGHELGAEVYRRTLYQSYSVHVTRNSGEILGGLNKVGTVISVIFSLLNAFSAGLMALFIIAALIFIDPIVAATALAGFGSIYVFVSVLTSKRLARNSTIGSEMANARMQTVQEGLGNIRDILLSHAQPVFTQRFNHLDSALCQAQASNSIIGPSPRYAVESLGMVFIAFLGYSMTTKGDGIDNAIPTLGALALGAQRLMPLVQQMYLGWVMVVGNKQIIKDVLQLLQQPVTLETLTIYEPLTFQHNIKLQNLSFRYHSHLPFVISQLSLTISKGARLGLMGTTGSGKSTVIDLLMGLLTPSEGQILIDDKPLTSATRLAWQRNVAHVPQTICLSDGTFAENIAFGIPIDQIDMDRVQYVADQAQISNHIQSNQLGYFTKVGERGVKLSGGQRQRIGIARALYKQASILIFDEATSALDNETESTVMQAIEALSNELTIVIVAHRLTTLKKCNQIIELEHGIIKRMGSYDQIIKAV